MEDKEILKYIHKLKELGEEYETVYICHERGWESNKEVGGDMISDKWFIYVGSETIISFNTKSELIEHIERIT